MRTGTALWSNNRLIVKIHTADKVSLSHDPHGPSQEWTRHDVNIYIFFNNVLAITWQPDIIIIALHLAVCCWTFHMRRTAHRQRLHSYHTYSVTALRLSLPESTAPVYRASVSLTHTYLYKDILI